MNTSSEYFDINLLNLIKRFWSLKFYFISFWIITVVITLAVNTGKINSRFSGVSLSTSEFFTNKR